ncbi:putative Serine-type D-Ala-D-Ala carboxypeptidase [Tenacibaculum litopenaei]|uniref:serine hydrolase n=1 Tax=Tenacibaculum litopenaei TaxID=396016 RepID=UPI0038962F95
MKYVSILVIWCCSLVQLTAQITLTGRVLDANTQTGIEGVNIFIARASVGTITNENGSFRLRIPKALTAQKHELVASHIGYSLWKTEVNSAINKALEIHLEEFLNPLEGVEILSEKPEKVISEAIKKIPENYPSKAWQLNGYYQELVKTNGDYTMYSDAICKIDYSSYKKKFKFRKSMDRYVNYTEEVDESNALNRSNFFKISFPIVTYQVADYRDKCSLLATRNTINTQQVRYGLFQRGLGLPQGSKASKLVADLEASSISGGPLGVLACDKVKRRADFLKLENLEKYSFIFKESSSYLGRAVYVFEFEPKQVQAETPYSGSILIDKASKAIVGFDYVLDEKLLEDKKIRARRNVTMGKGLAGLEMDVKSIQMILRHKVKVRYALLKGKWYPQQVKYENEYRNTINSLPPLHQSAVVNLLITEVKTADDNFTPIKRSELFKSTMANYVSLVQKPDVLGLYTKANLVLPASLTQKAINDYAMKQKITDATSDQEEFIDYGGYVVGVANGKGNYTVRAYGNSEKEVPVTEEMSFGIGSNTKTFTAVLVYKCMEKGLLSSNQTIGELLPEFEVNHIDKNITVNQLLHHASGIYDPLNESDDLINRALSEPEKAISNSTYFSALKQPYFAPGTQYKYSNINYTILGLILERVTKKSYAELLNEEILIPLDLKHTFYWGMPSKNTPLAYSWLSKGKSLKEFSRNGIKSLAGPAGSIFSNAFDMLRWYEALFGGKVLSEASMKAMLKTGKGDDGLNYGAGIFVEELINGPRYFHSGETIAYSSYILYKPFGQRCVVVLVNQIEADPETIALKVLEKLR